VRTAPETAGGVKVTWTPEAIRALGVRTDVPTAGEIVAGLCRTESYSMAERGEFPVPIVRVGRRLVVPVAPILQLLGIGPPDMDVAAPEPPGPATKSTSPPLPTPRNTTENDNT
jgi:hypothetical protein